MRKTYSVKISERAATVVDKFCPKDGPYKKIGFIEEAIVKHGENLGKVEREARRIKG